MMGTLWKWLAAAALAVVLLAVGAFAGVNLYLARRNQNWLSEAQEAYKRGDWIHAKGCYERYLPQDPSNIALLLQYADACLNIRPNRLAMLQNAATAYQQILTYEPDNRDVRAKLIDLYSKIGAWSTLEYYTNEWLSRTPDDASLQYHHAIALDRMGRRDEAMREYSVLAENNTEFSDVYGSLARLMRDRGLDANALDMFNKALERRPDDARLLVDYARFRARRSTWADVEPFLKQALESAPTDTYVLLACAQAALLRRQYDRAIELLEKVVELEPQGATAQMMLTAIYRNQGRLDAAIEALKSVDPIVQADNPIVLVTLADLQIESHALDDAKVTIADYNSIQPDQLPINEYFAGKELLVRGEATEAIKRLAPAVELRPGFHLGHYTLAEAYLAAGEMELARSSLATYLSRNPTDERAQRLMAQRFGKPISPDSLAARAEELIARPSVDVSQLVAVGTALSSTAVSPSQLQEQAPRIERALERAIEIDPRQAAPYRAKAELALRLGDADRARQVLSRAQAAGVPDTELSITRTVTALALGDTAAADAILLEATAKPDFGQSQYIEWANYLAQHGHYDHAIALLGKGTTRYPSGDVRAALEIERARLAVRHGDFDRAAAWIADAEPRIAKGTALRRTLNTTRLQIAQAFLTVNGTDAQARARALIDAVRAEDAANSLLQTIDGFMLLRENPPDLDTAQSLFERAAASDAAGLIARWGLARVALARGDFPRALSHAERAAALNPQSPALQVLLAEVLLRLGRSSEAEPVLARALETSPHDVTATQLMIECLLALGRTDAARQHLAKLESLSSANEDLRRIVSKLRGTILIAAGDDQEAERLLREQLEKGPGDTDLLEILALQMARQGRREEAKTLITDYANAHPDDPAPWVVLAKVLLFDRSTASYREASTALTRALLIDDNFIPALREFLSVRLAEGDRVEALALCEKYLRRNPDEPDMLNTKAVLLADIPNRQLEALATIDRAVSLDDRPELLATRGIVLVAMRDYDRALKDLQAAAQSLPKSSARVDAALAEAYLATNEIALARQHIEAAVKKAQNGDSVNLDRLRSLQVAIRQREAA
ncbi:MAG: hypothetical protein AMXMBFR4_12030 [Candidatus Hydrogenedentota bacterium]